MTTSPWFKIWKPNPDASVNLFCFPHAGGGSLTFKDWAQYQPDQFQIICARLPGRETRLKEPLEFSIEPVICGLLEAVEPLLDKKFVFFGHSLGSLICFDLVRALRREGLPLPLHLFVSGRRAPQVLVENPVSWLSEDEFVDKLRRYNGIPNILLEKPGILKLFLPSLRADFQLSDDYIYRDEPPLDFPMSLFHGADDKITELEKLMAWREHTVGDFDFMEFPGDHFYVNDQGAAILKAIVDRLEKQ